jgi:diacylglycerol kinase
MDKLARIERVRNLAKHAEAALGKALMCKTVLTQTLQAVGMDLEDAPMVSLMRLSETLELVNWAVERIVDELGSIEQDKE